MNYWSASEGTEEQKTAARLLATGRTPEQDAAAKEKAIARAHRAMARRAREKAAQDFPANEDES